MILGAEVEPHLDSGDDHRSKKEDDYGPCEATDINRAGHHSTLTEQGNPRSPRA
jgi:hypothetical protein